MKRAKNGTKTFLQRPYTDKMAENKFYFGRKWQTKNLYISKKSSTFVA